MQKLQQAQSMRIAREHNQFDSLIQVALHPHAVAVSNAACYLSAKCMDCLLTTEHSKVSCTSVLKAYFVGTLSREQACHCNCPCVQLCDGLIDQPSKPDRTAKLQMEAPQQLMLV